MAPGTQPHALEVGEMIAGESMIAKTCFIGCMVLPGFPARQLRLDQRLFKSLVFITTFTAKAFFELAKDSGKALPFGHDPIPLWLRPMRLLSLGGGS